jgi:hypothetical protein
MNRPEAEYIHVHEGENIQRTPPLKEYNNRKANSNIVMSHRHNITKTTVNAFAEMYFRITSHQYLGK